MEFCRLICCFKICPCQNGGKTDDALQGEPPPIVVPPLPRSSTSSQLRTRPEISTTFQDIEVNSRSSANSFACMTGTSEENAQHQNATNLKSRIPSISAILDSLRNLVSTIPSSELPTSQSLVTSSMLNYSPLHRDESMITIQSPKIPKSQVTNSATHFPLAVPLEPEQIWRSTTLEPTPPYLDTPATLVNSSDPFASSIKQEDAFAELGVLDTVVPPTLVVPLVSESVRPSTISKAAFSPLEASMTTVKPSFCFLPPPLILSASSLIRQSSHPLQRILPNEHLLTDLLRSFQTHHIPVLPKTTAYQLESLDPKSTNFVYNVLFRNRKFRGYYEIKAAKRVWNPYLMVHYELNRRKYGGNFEYRFMFHGTSPVAANAILKHNFDWRKVNEVTLGKGVYFANNPYFASHYGRRSADSRIDDYVMIVAKVLIEKEEIQRGFPHSMPPPGHSTTSENKQELVKFDDCVFYPDFLVFYRPL